MRNIELIYYNYLSLKYTNITDVVLNEDEDKKVMNVYALKEITLDEIQRMINDFKNILKINLEFIKYEKIVFTDICLIVFEVSKDE